MFPSMSFYPVLDSFFFLNGESFALKSRCLLYLVTCLSRKFPTLSFCSPCATKALWKELLWRIFGRAFRKGAEADAKGPSGGKRHDWLLKNCLIRAWNLPRHVSAENVRNIFCLWTSNLQLRSVQHGIMKSVREQEVCQIPGCLPAAGRGY